MLLLLFLLLRVDGENERQHTAEEDAERRADNLNQKEEDRTVADNKPETRTAEEEIAAVGGERDGEMEEERWLMGKEC